MIAAICAFPASAAETAKFYGGASIGQNTVEIDEVDFSGTATAFKIFFGARISEHFDFEGAYIHGGSADDTFFGTTVEVETTAFQVAFIGNLPVSDQFTLFAKLGGVAGEAKASADGDSVSDDGNGIMYGIGGKLNFDKAQLRLEFETADVEDTEIQLISLGLSVPF